MYGKNDPRSKLDNSHKMDLDSPIKAPHYVEFDYIAPQIMSDASTTWITRGTHFSLTYSKLKKGQTLERKKQKEEYLVILPHSDSAATFYIENIERAVSGQALVVIPPGDSLIKANADTEIVRLFDERTEDIIEQAENKQDFNLKDPRIPVLEVGKEPIDGHKLRIYPLEDIEQKEGRFGRIFRTQAFMVNILYPFYGPRPKNQLSPHYHNNFEQCSLAVSGQFEHHIRTPWTADMSTWRNDDHRLVGSPSVTLIPPPTIHTTRACGENENQLIDIFCPPRDDFSAREGWVLNADEYPL